tara:strand:+ start:446 stop:640 length:195 start_codon:yes stop_codon:yes gene_type:complete
MSGDCKNQPVIFYSEEMTEAKIFLLRHHGIKLRVRDNKYYYNSVTNNEDIQRISGRKQSKQNQV